MITKSTSGPFKEGMAGAMECVVFREKSGNDTGLIAPCYMKFTGSDDGLNLLAKRNIGTIQSSGSGGKGTQELYGTGGMKNIKTQELANTQLNFMLLIKILLLGKCKWSN